MSQYYATSDYNDFDSLLNSMVNDAKPKPIRPGSKFQSLVDIQRQGKDKVGAATSGVEFKLLGHDASVGYRYLLNKIQESADAMDQHLQKLSQQIMEYYGWDELSNPSHTSQWQIYTAGRICCDSAHTSDSKKLDEYSLMLEPCLAVGNGTRVRLDLSLMVQRDEGISLFPGQVLGIRGFRKDGGSLVVEQVYDLPPMQRSPRDGSVEEQPFSAVSASGPFTSDANLDYEPLKKIVDAINRRQPTVAVLLGPFIDLNHPMLSTGEYSELAIEELFQTRVSALLREISAKTLVLLVPSLKDALTDYVTLPQPPLDAGVSEQELSDNRRRKLCLPDSLKCLPNPFLCSINGRVLGGCTVDVLRHLSSNEIYRSGSLSANQTHKFPADRLSRIAHHLLLSRSFYPLYPPPRVPIDLSSETPSFLRLNQFADAVPLDYSNYRGMEISEMPDVLFLPSVLAPFAKRVDGVDVVNPSLATRETLAILELGCGSENSEPASFGTAKGNAGGAKRGVRIEKL